MKTSLSITKPEALLQTEEEFNCTAEAWCATCVSSMWALCKHVEPLQVLQLGLLDPERHFGNRNVAGGYGRKAKTGFSSAHYHVSFVLFGLARNHALEDSKVSIPLLDLSWPGLHQVFFSLLLVPIPNEAAHNAWTILIY